MVKEIMLEWAGENGRGELDDEGWASALMGWNSLGRDLLEVCVGAQI